MLSIIVLALAAGTGCFVAESVGTDPASLPGPLSIFDGEGEGGEATASILERLHPLCTDEAMVQLQLQGELTRSQFHQLDLNRIRQYGEEHCFALTVDDSALSFLPEQEFISSTPGQVGLPWRDERLSPREELIAIADEWIAAVPDEQEQKALQATKEELVSALRNL